MSRSSRKAPGYSPEAKMDIADAARWFQRTYSFAVSRQFLRAIKDCVAHVAEYPEACELVFGDFRKAVVQGFSYSVFYVYKGDNVTVMAVMHWRRDPRDWQSRAR